MTIQANIQEQIALLTISQLTNRLDRHHVGAIKFVGGLRAELVTAAKDARPHLNPLELVRSFKKCLV